MRRFIIAGTGDRAGDLGVIALGIEWMQSGPCALYWPRDSVSSNYPNSIEVKKQIENDHIKVLWTDQDHIPIINSSITDMPHD